MIRLIALALIDRLELLRALFDIVDAIPWIGRSFWEMVSVLQRVELANP